VKTYKAQVEADSAVGQRSVTVLWEMQTYKKQKLLHQYACFSSAAMLTSKY